MPSACGEINACGLCPAKQIKKRVQGDFAHLLQLDTSRSTTHLEMIIRLFTLAQLATYHFMTQETKNLKLDS